MSSLLTDIIMHFISIYLLVHVIKKILAVTDPFIGSRHV